MKFLKNLFSKSQPEKSASLAKDRLKVIIKKDERSSNPLLIQIENEIIDAIRKYANVNPDNVESKMKKEIEIMHLNCKIEGRDTICDKETESFFNVLFSKKKNSASTAKDRLQFIISNNASFEFSEKLARDIKNIVKKYSKHDPDKVNIEKIYQNEIEMLALDISIPNNLVD